LQQIRGDVVFRKPTTASATTLRMESGIRSVVSFRWPAPAAFHRLVHKGASPCRQQQKLGVAELQVDHQEDGKCL
jgi:hypothetical protein